MTLKMTQENNNRLTDIGRNLSDFQLEFKTIQQERDKLFEQLQTCESKSDSNEANISPHFVIFACLLIIILIAFLISIVKISQLSKHNKFMNAKLDKLCEDHVYETVD